MKQFFSITSSESGIARTAVNMFLYWMYDDNMHTMMYISYITIQVACTAGSSEASPTIQSCMQILNYYHYSFL